MGFIKRAWLSVSRRKGKSLVLLAIIFVLSNAIAGAVSIRQAAANVEKQIKTQLGGAASIELDGQKYEKAIQNAADPNSISTDLPLEVIRQVGKSAYIDYYDYTVNRSISGKNIKPWTPSAAGDFDSDAMLGGDADFMLKGTNLSDENFNKMLTKDLKASWLDAKSRAFTKEEIDNGLPKVIITKELAEQNNLHVGDKLQLETKVFDYFTKEEKSESATKEPYARQDVVLEIVGIFEDKAVAKTSSSKRDKQMDVWQQFHRKNTVYVPNRIVENELKFSTEKELELIKKAQFDTPDQVGNSVNFTPRYMLKNPEDVTAFKEESQSLLPEIFTIVAATDSYDSIAGPIRSVSKMAGYVLVASIGATILIITLVILLFLRDRKHELGIYLSLGEKKSKVIGQILLEVMMITVLAVTISVFTGNMLAGGL